MPSQTSNASKKRTAADLKASQQALAAGPVDAADAQQDEDAIQRDAADEDDQKRAKEQSH